MQNILHVIAFLLNCRLGSRTRFQGLLEQSQFSHRVLSTAWPGAIDKAIHQECGPNWLIDELWGNSLLTLRGAFYLSWLFLRVQIGFKAKQCGAQVIQAHNPTLISLAAADVARWLRLPFIFETHGLSGTETPTVKQVLTKGHSIERKLTLEASKVIVQTLAMKNSLVDLYGIAQEKVVILPNFVDANYFDPSRWQTEGYQMRQKWGVREDERVFLYSGFINWYNGIPELLEAFSEAHFDRPAHLVVCGDGELVDRVREAEKDSPNRVSYIGMVNHSKMPAVYAAADCLVLARPDVAETREATPMKLLEAMVMEKLVLCSRVAGMTEVADDQTAVLIKSGAIEELRRCLESISNNFVHYKPLGINARVKVVQKFTMAAVGQKLDRIYEELGCQH